MSTRVVARLWLGLGAAGLLLLWVALLFRPLWLSWAGVAFIAVPFAASVLEFMPGARKDPGSAVAALGLVVLFWIAWLL